MSRCGRSPTASRSRGASTPSACRRLAGGLAALGVGPGDTVGFMLTNRPEFHLLDTAAMHLGATPFSIYNTSSPEQIAYLLGDAANRVMIVEAAFMDRVAAVLEGGQGSVEHLVVLDGATSDSITLEELESAEPPAGFDFEAALAGSRARRHPHADLHVGHDRSAEGRAAHARQRNGAVPRARRRQPLAERRGVDRVVFADGAHRRPRPHALRPDGVGRDAHLLPRGHPGVRPRRRRSSDPLGRGPGVWEKLKAALEAGIAADPDEARRAAVLAAIELDSAWSAPSRPESPSTRTCSRPTSKPTSTCSRRCVPGSGSTAVRRM